MKIEEILDSLNIDKNLTLDRFCRNENLLLRFIKKFPSDTNFFVLKEAIQKNDLSQIEYTAHTLKGVCANLGFEKLAGDCTRLVSAVRNKELDFLPSLFLPIEDEYNRLITYIEKIE